LSAKKCTFEENNLKMKLKDLKLNEKNPRKIKPEKLEKLKQSLQEFEQMMEARPIVVDETMTILGGNMRYTALKALGFKEIPDNWVFKMEGLTEEQKKEFIIKDNVGFGEWDWELLVNEWDVSLLESWGLEVQGFDIDSDEFGEDFTLPNGDKSPFQQMTFTFADEQAVQIKNALADIKQTEEYKYCETMGNENSNGNALYLIVMQWAGQKT
jgi:hypothetical protein